MAITTSLIVVHRRDPASVALCSGFFVEAVMKLCLLAEDYTPYWKWLPAEISEPARLGYAI
jgi:hypothetical protein